MKVIINKLIPFKGYKSITFYPFIFTRKKLSDVDYNHESIHAEQQKELLFILFFILYILEYIIKLIITFDNDKAYESISFEQEAYSFQKDKDYLNKRKRYNWINYIFKLI